MNSCGINKHNKKIAYGSVCSGIEAASVAWEPLGLSPAWFAQFDPEHDYSKGPDFPSAVLAHHWPHIPNLGDMTKIANMLRDESVCAPDILVGGTPCQAFSVAGMRNGLDDARGQLTIKFVEIADEIDKQRGAGNECVILWENVPGVLSSKDNAFGCFLAGLVGEDCELVPPGCKWSNAGCVSGPKRTVAWRIIDAQHFGVAQRRRRVFVVASARDGFDPTSVLFEREGVRRDTAPSRACRSEADYRAHGSTASGSQLFACLVKGASKYHNQANQEAQSGDYHIIQNGRIRNPTIYELCRLQGFPDRYFENTTIGYWHCAGMLGNSMAAPVMAWLGKRMINELTKNE